MPDVENDALICDAVAAVAMQTPLPAYIKPAELAGLTRLPPQTIGLTVGRLFGIARIRIGDTPRLSWWPPITLTAPRRRSDWSRSDWSRSVATR